MAARKGPPGFHKNGKSGWTPNAPGQVLGLKVDTKSLDNLAYGLQDLSAQMSSKIISSAMREALPGATKVAKDLTVKVGGYDVAGKSAQARRGIRHHMKGDTQAAIASVNTWWSLHLWGDNKDPMGDYRRHGLRGVRTTGHYGSHTFFAPGAKEAFVRVGNSGNTMLFGRQGSARLPLHAYHAVNAAHVLHQHAVHDPTVEKFQERLDIRFTSKLQGAIAQIKAKYGL